jgi:hypothetical protein
MAPAKDRARARETIKLYTLDSPERRSERMRAARRFYQLATEYRFLEDEPYRDYLEATALV